MVKKSNGTTNATETEKNEQPDITALQILEALGQMAKRPAGDTDIRHEGTQITLPAQPKPMTIPTAIEVLERKQQIDEEETDVHEIVEDGYYPDTLHAFSLALKKTYGWVQQTHTTGWFGMKIPPKLINVQTGPRPEDTIQVPLGAVQLPGIKGKLETRLAGVSQVHFIGSFKRVDAEAVKAIVAETKRILKTNSIYKGKAFILKQNDLPEFIDTSSIVPEELVLNKTEQQQVDVALWAPIRFSQQCRKAKIPLKRGVLLEGTYGCGKTMVATVTARVTEDNGWTYIMVTDTAQLVDALKLAKRYQPAVIFAEDIDRHAEHRDERGNDILNTIDGMLAKTSEVICVLTTNHVDKINKAMLRPGRLDAVIRVKAPEPDAVLRLIHSYGAGLVDPDGDYTQVCEALAGNIPATIREVVERGKLSMIAHGRDKVAPDDLLVMATAMQTHLELLAERPVEPSLEHKLGAAMGDLVNNRLENRWKVNGTTTLEAAMRQQIEEIHESTV